ncbi:MAG: penicillin-binding protein 1C, partial [Verrucomicrobiales bacterium]
MALLLLWIGLAGYWVLPWVLPLPHPLGQSVKPGLDFRDRSGVPLRKVLAGGARVEAALALENIPRDLIEATVCAEDKRFRSHGGIDFLALARAARDWVVTGEARSGASTITQQLVKITSPRRPRTPRFKLIEMLTARKLEMLWSKDQILGEYLNRLDYGNLLVGCNAASRGYFAKPPADLTLAECAFLAGIPQAPTRLDPYRHRREATKRQRWIIAKMVKEDRTGARDAARAFLEPLRLKSAYHVFEAPHAIDLILGQGLAERPHPGAERGARLIRTTIDLGLQREVEAILETGLGEIAARNVCQGAVVVIENGSGEVLALAGSRDYFSPEGGQINGAWSPRSPGSALKPFTYLLAMERGGSPATIVDDLPVIYPGRGGAYRPVNYDKRFYGPMTYRAALANSLNVSAIKVLERIGGPEPLHRTLVNCGLSTLRHPSEYYGLGLTLGNAEVRLLELANAYACLARLGIYRPWRLLKQDRSVNDAGVRLFDGDASYLLADMLSDKLARSPAFGAHSVLNLPFRVACKTGTSTDFRDNWTLGYTPEFTVGVWVGNFDNTPMRGVSGVTGAGPVFNRVFTSLQRRRSSSWYPQPGAIVSAEIDIRNGKRWNGEIATRGRKSVVSIARRRELFRAANLPPLARAQDYDSAGRALLPGIYAGWLAGDDNWLGDHALTREGSHPKRSAVILSPEPGSTIYLDPDLPDRGG